MATPTLYTLGHGDRSLDEVLDILQMLGITCVVDVRSYPQSRRHPQFSRAMLEPFLREAGISYLWRGEELGGFRKACLDSPHLALDDNGLRAYADHMTSGLFQQGIDDVMQRAISGSLALLCAESLPQRCHRGLIADYLSFQGWSVLHALDVDNVAPHRLSALARPCGSRLVYDQGVSQQLGLGL